MSWLSREICLLSSEAKRNIRELFSNSGQEEVIDENGKRRYINNSYQWPANPFPILARLTVLQWMFFACGILTFSVEYVDTFAVTVQTTKIAKFYGVDKASVTGGMTLGQLVKPLGGIVFGILGDLVGRKYPYILGCLGLALFQVGTVYCSTFRAFLIVRGFFGFCMGAMWALTACTALEEANVEARGILSGLFLTGSCFGYILVCVVNMIVGDAPTSWVTVFWMGAGLSFFCGFFRLALPEASQFRKFKRKEDEACLSGERKRPIVDRERVRLFCQHFKVAFRKEWRVITYAVILVCIHSSISHATIDSYTTFLLTTKQMSNRQASTGSIIMKAGGIPGAPLIGWISQSFGRRRSIVVCSVAMLVLIPWWVLPSDPKVLAAGGFFFVIFVQGIGGLFPIHLNELAPAQFRVLIAGFAFQFGGFLSSPASYIINLIAENTLMPGRNGKPVETYGPVLGIFTAGALILLILWSMVGPERRSSHFEAVAPAGMQSRSEVDNLSVNSFALVERVESHPGFAGKANFI